MGSGAFIQKPSCHLPETVAAASVPASFLLVALGPLAYLPLPGQDAVPFERTPSLPFHHRSLRPGDSGKQILWMNSSLETVSPAPGTEYVCKTTYCIDEWEPQIFAEPHKAFQISCLCSPALRGPSSTAPTARILHHCQELAFCPPRPQGWMKAPVPRPMWWAGMLPPPLTNSSWLSTQLGEKSRDTGSPYAGAPMGCTVHRVEIGVEVQPGPRGPSAAPYLPISGCPGPPGRAENGTTVSRQSRASLLPPDGPPARRRRLLCCCHDGSLACPG